MAISAEERPFVAAFLSAGAAPDVAVAYAKRVVSEELPKRPNATMEWQEYYAALLAAGRPLDAAASIADEVVKL